MDTTLDATDRRILHVLQREGRITNAELSERVNLSPSACHRRVQRLEEDGYIARYVALLDTRRIGKPYLVAKSKSRWSCPGTAMIAPVP